MAARPVTAVAVAGVAGVAGAALLVKRALHRRIVASPLWPMPALEEPLSGRPRSRALRLRIAAREPVAEGVVQLRLTQLRPDSRELPEWEPGAHIDLVLSSGLVRQYSLCGDPGDRSAYTVAVRLVEGGRGGSREVHEELTEGTEVEARGPRNRFPLTAGASSYVFVAGGIGITPILPMLRALPEGTKWRLVYGGRSRASMPFLKELEELGELGAGRVILAEGRDELAASIGELEEDDVVYCCGPEELMAAVEERVPSVRLERFAARSSEGAAFEVELRRSERVLKVAADSSVLAAVRAELPDTLYSCEQGFCGTCQQRVLEGEVEHRDELLTDAERRDSMLICVSRARGGRIVLDM